MALPAPIAAFIQRIIILVISAGFGGLATLFIVFRIITNPLGFFFPKKRINPPSIGHDPRYGEHKKTVIKGHTLHYVANGSPDKPLMLLIHGFPENWWSWRNQLAAFSTTHYVVAISLPGYGDSERLDRISDYRLKNVIEIIRALIEHLGYKQAIIVAHDMGGAIGWTLSATYPSIVKKFIVLDCPHVQVFVKRASLQLLIQSWYLFLHQIPYIAELFWSINDMEAVEFSMASKLLGDEKLAKSEEMEYHKYYLGKLGFTGPINYARAVLSYEQLLDGLISRRRNIVERIKPKTLIIWGGNDLAMAPELGFASVEYCEDARVEVIEGGSHWIQQQEPARVNLLIRQFIDEDK